MLPSGPRARGREGAHDAHGVLDGQAVLVRPVTDNIRGGFACPYCPHREFIRSFLDQHIAREHPDQEATR